MQDSGAPEKFLNQVISSNGGDMTDFYSEWLANSERIDKAISEAPRVARASELKWVQTRQDYKAALVIAPETGFPTGGSLRGWLAHGCGGCRQQFESSGGSPR